MNSCSSSGIWCFSCQKWFKKKKFAKGASLLLIPQIIIFLWNERSSEAVILTKYDFLASKNKKKKREGDGYSVVTEYPCT